MRNKMHLFTFQNTYLILAAQNKQKKLFLQYKQNYLSKLILKKLLLFNNICV